MSAHPNNVTFLISCVWLHNIVTFICRHLYPDKRENLDKLRQHLLESSNEMAPLKVWQVQELSLQAAERIMSSPKEEALKVLTNIAQNFPLQVSKFIGSPAFRQHDRNVDSVQLTGLLVWYVECIALWKEHGVATYPLLVLSWF